MPNLKDDNFSEEQTKLISAIQEGFKKTIKPLIEKLNYIYQSLVDQDLIKPFAKANSPKQITERGWKLLKEKKVDFYLEKECELLKDEELKNKTDAQIFIECLEWVKTKGKEKMVEIMLNNNIMEEQCNELLSLAIMEKIKSTNKTPK